MPTHRFAVREGRTFFSAATDRVPEGELRGQLHAPHCYEAELRNTSLLPPSFGARTPYAFANVMLSRSQTDYAVLLQLPTDKARTLSVSPYPYWCREGRKQRKLCCCSCLQPWTHALTASANALFLRDSMRDGSVLSQLLAAKTHALPWIHAHHFFRGLFTDEACCLSCLQPRPTHFLYVRTYVLLGRFDNG